MSMSSKINSHPNSCFGCYVPGISLNIYQVCIMVRTKQK